MIRRSSLYIRMYVCMYVIWMVHVMTYVHMYMQYPTPTFSEEMSCPALSNSSGAMNPGVPTGELSTLSISSVDT